MWQIRLYRFAIGLAVMLWVVSGTSSLPASRRALLFVLGAAAIPYRFAAAAVLAALVVLVPERDTPALPVYAALAWSLFAGQDRVSTAALVAGQLFALISMFAPRSAGPWIAIAIPALIPPSAIRGRQRREQSVSPERLFYDGHCGLCHHAIQFLLAEDCDGTKFRFAPLDSEAFRATVPEAVRASLPDSVVVFTEDGRTLCRSTAAIHVFHRLGGYWRVLAILATPVPSALLDALYDGIAKIRHKLFKPPADVCPLMPKELRARFDY